MGVSISPLEYTSTILIVDYDMRLLYKTDYLYEDFSKYVYYEN